ncbi:MAG: ABC transporter ATP-binding protein/permease [Firmicutes bacterium]|nr:ABC transporter ATP-binding protein/permease [Bacillota bacterium]
MLKLDNIKKDYPTSSMIVHALKGVSINFRNSEFVSILGPSGCGKTTMLNIIGGLDKLTDGDLKINGRSTKDFKSSDWDVYRNHRIGFVFQSYNLIPHQTVLANVELALTIAGVDKTTRREKAKAALVKVGLADQTHKKPNQLSGGQCQRVAIARALVNDPEILLADEPTGALDTETSRQVMDLIKEISKERLVIMVTHNPELANHYSTRIIHLLDGLLLSDSNPMSEEELAAQETIHNEKIAADDNIIITQSNDVPSVYTESAKTAIKKEKAKMSFFTAFRLSLSNLFTKKARTIVMAVASAIGIIGVSLVLAISFGVQNFITDMQHDMLAGNPIQVNQTGFDIDAMTNLMTPDEIISFDRQDFLNIEAVIANLYEMIETSDDIFVQNRIDRSYIQFLNQMPEHYFSAMHFNYGLNTTYSFFNSFNERHTSLAGILATYAAVLQNIPGFSDFADLLGMMGNPIRQSPDFSTDTAREYLLSQFDIVATAPNHDGIATQKNEVMIVLSQDHVLTDIMLGQLGVFDQDEFINIVHGITDDPNFNEDLFSDRMDFSRLLNQQFVWQPNNNIFSAPTRFINVLEDPDDDDADFGHIPFQYNPIMDINATDGLELTVVGILSPKEDVSIVMMDAGVFYTRALAEYIVYRNWNSDFINFMRDNDTDTLIGMSMDLPIPPNFPSSLPLPIAAISGNVIPFVIDYSYGGQDGIMISLVGSGGGSLMSLFMGGMGGGGAGAMEGINMANIGMRQFGGNIYRISIRELDDDGEYLYERVLDRNGNPAYIRVVDDAGNYVMNGQDYVYEPHYAPVYKQVIHFDANGNVTALPNSISIFSSSFAQVDLVTEYLRSWNGSDDIILNFADGSTVTLRPSDRDRVQHTDMLSFIMGMVSQLIQIITIALVSFTALSLVVSSVMIGILTYVSVMERIKEIGVIRSLGGRKKDVSNLFTAETFILGFTSGLFGIIITYMLSLFINLIVRALAGITIASLPIWVAAIMIGISVLLTVVAGAMPSRSAAKKDPVKALRSE